MVRRVVVFLAALAAGVLVLGVVPASAATGSWTSTKNCGNGLYVQGHYSYYYSSGVRYVRADGYSVSSSGAGYIRGVVVAELRNNSVWGSRKLNFTGSATSSSTTSIPESYLPYMLSGPSSVTTMSVDVVTSSGRSCSYYSIPI